MTLLLACFTSIRDTKRANIFVVYFLLKNVNLIFGMAVTLDPTLPVTYEHTLPGC